MRLFVIPGSNKCHLIQKTDIGVAADLGTLQRFPKIIGNDSTARELALTARPFMRPFVIPGSNKCHCYSGN